MNKLTIKDLHVEVEGKTILKGINAEFETNKIYALIGPNGNGKSTLLSTIMGDPNFVITKGQVLLDGVSINKWDVEKRSKAGIFLGMQYPPEIAGVSNLDLVKSSLESKNEEVISKLSVYSEMLSYAEDLRFEESLLQRDVNVGFSGGEKKKNELLQMLMLEPKFALLDEIDSGLDVDSIEAISKLLSEQKKTDKAIIIVSHYKKLYDSLKPDVVYVLKDGKISNVGDVALLNEILAKGFDNA